MSRTVRIGSLMTHRLVFVAAEASVQEAQALMEQHGIRNLPVMKGDKLVGLLTDRDISLSLDPMFGLPPMRKVRDIMIRDPYIVDVAKSLHDVLSILIEHRVGSVLVTQHGKLAGIFTTTDAAKLLREHYRNPST